MVKLPTDFKILSAIYGRYYSDFQAYSKDNKKRSSKIYVPIDIVGIAKSLGVDEDIIFGRLYYHLNKKYGYTQDNGSKVFIFTPICGDDKDCVNFPLLASVLAKLKDENIKFLWTLCISIISLVIAIVSIIISVFT